MFLTTEPSLPGRAYVPMQVIFGVGSANDRDLSGPKSERKWNMAISQALAVLAQEATQLGANGVIAVHLSTSDSGGYIHATVMGTAIKFQQP